MAIKKHHLEGIFELLVFIYLHRFLDPVLIAYSQNYALLYALSNYIWIQNVLYMIWQWLYQKYMHVELYKLVHARWATSWCTFTLCNLRSWLYAILFYATFIVIDIVKCSWFSSFRQSRKYWIYMSFSSDICNSSPIIKWIYALNMTEWNSKSKLFAIL